MYSSILFLMGVSMPLTTQEAPIDGRAKREIRKSRLDSGMPPEQAVALRTLRREPLGNIWD